MTCHMRESVECIAGGRGGAGGIVDAAFCFEVGVGNDSFFFSLEVDEGICSVPAAHGVI